MNRYFSQQGALLGLLLGGSVLMSACEPQDRRPGLWLSGQAAGAPADWTFVNEPREVFLETHPWYGIPHSVTVVVAEANGKVFVPSIYDEDLPFPGTKRWNTNIAADPNVRLKVGDAIYEMTARPAANDEEWQEGFAALAAKYDFWQELLDDESKRPPFAIIRLEAR
ncbi:MAG: DUF385 domain-containing protein [Gammaproteobacteria bacterium]|nr:MAG: DUF385 domain-containing protein [Gammaproteobacteria bacterium]TDJ40793.1 MAG: DUF385 domain-containing protein [Gammaproteobacteria bacterium]